MYRRLIRRTRYCLAIQLMKRANEYIKIALFQMTQYPRGSFGWEKGCIWADISWFWFELAEIVKPQSQT